MVDVLAGHDGSDAGGVLALDADLLVAELSLLGGHAALHLLGLVVLVRPMLDGDDVVVMLLLHAGGVVDGLHGGVEVILVDLLVDGSLHVLVLGLGDGLVDDRGRDLLVDGGVVVARLGHEVLNCCFGGVHFGGFDGR